MLNHNQLETAKVLIQTVRQATPLLRKIDDLKGVMRDIGPGSYPVPGEGEVKVSEPAERAPKGTALVLDVERFNSLSNHKQAELMSLGIIKTETLYTQKRASSVSVDVA